MPQKQAHDRLHLLCQSRELNPLVSLTLDAPTDKNSARFGAASYVSSASQQHLVQGGANSTETKKQYSSSVKSTGTN